ncbi:MAG: translation initiation factor IF-2 [Nanoarchaeota archaeon]|nr:translation initiation factor IF-2 [Nanoarchaeota archaeon]
MKKIRQPIITIAGHVDHGKTSILDKLRGSCFADKEAGRITQKISFTKFPAENIKKTCYLLEKYKIKLKIPGFLYIDTPGHQAFTNLRKRGGSLADLAILVIDVNEGIMPQTAEVIQILKQNKTPFIIALNKIDSISGWQKLDDDLKKNIEKQSMNVKQQFQEKFYKIVAALEANGFKSDFFYEVKDFTEKIAIVPCSAKTSEGLPELMMVLCGLSQKFLSKQLNLGENAKGVIFEIKKTKTMNYIEAILYDGSLKQGDEIAIASFDKPIISKIRVLEEVCALSDKFENKKHVIASTGIRMQLTESKDILPGMPFQIFKNNLEKAEKELKKDLGEIKLDSEGIIIKTESLGSLEALLTLLKQNNIKVLKAGIGNINKTDIVSAKTNQKSNPLYSVILGFNVDIDEDAKEISSGIKILTEDVIYKLIDEIQKWQEEKRKEIEKEKLLGLSSIFKIEILPKYVFRNSKPAIFGVRVLSGKVKSNVSLIDENSEEIARIKNIQSESKSIREAISGMEVAISLPGITFDRQLKQTKFLYSDITEKQFKKFKENKDVLSNDEIKTLQEIAEIKRKNKKWV